MFKLTGIMVEEYVWRAKEEENNFLILFVGLVVVPRLENSLLLKNCSSAFTRRKVTSSHGVIHIPALFQSQGPSAHLRSDGRKNCIPTQGIEDSCLAQASGLERQY